MKKGKMMYLLPGLFVVAMALVALGITQLGKNFKKETDVYKGKDLTVNSIINDNDVTEDEELTTPTVETKNIIIKPYTSPSVTLSKPFYDINDTEEKQQDSIIYYEGSYIQNKGSEYSSKEAFDVIGIMDGKVKNIKNDSNLGYSLTIEHDNELVTLYQYMSDVKVKEGQQITKGTILGTTNKSIIENTGEYTLHFEVKHKGEYINPETLFTMSVEDFE